MTTMPAVVGLAAHVLAVDVTGQHLSDVVRTAAGNLFIAVLAVLAAIELLRRRLIGTIVLLALAAVCGMFVYAPNVVHDLSTAIGNVLEGQ